MKVPHTPSRRDPVKGCTVKSRVEETPGARPEKAPVKVQTTVGLATTQLVISREADGSVWQRCRSAVWSSSDPGVPGRREPARPEEREVPRVNHRREARGRPPEFPTGVQGRTKEGQRGDTPGDPARAEARHTSDIGSRESSGRPECAKTAVR
jgi:hypothetical protein